MDRQGQLENEFWNAASFQTGVDRDLRAHPYPWGVISLASFEVPEGIVRLALAGPASPIPIEKALGGVESPSEGCNLIGDVSAVIIDLPEAGPQFGG